MLNSDHNDRLKLQLKVGKQRAATLLKQCVLEEFVYLFQDTGLQAMLLESEMEVMEQVAIRWVSVIVYYNDLGKRVKDEIQANSEQWTVFRDTTGVIEVEVFARPFTNPKKCMTRVDLKDLGGWDNSPVKYGVRPILIW
ncbi:hypothetical protein [Mastigocladopsis repens]|uniref:hypothetical protein n=1 Tax=Mastigocladopsis repens TaxID=221287 RepID=UPI000380C09F|nr:hypothetical protein [Mastigocladopsis repens]